VERELQRLRHATPKALLAAALKSEGEDRLQEETLVAIARHLVRQGQSEAAWKVASELASRVKKRLARVLRIWGMDRPEAQPSDIIDDALAALYESVLDASPRVLFWEVRFWVAFDRHLLNIVRRQRRAMETAMPEDAAADDDTPATDTSVDPLTNAIIKDALACLPEQTRTAFLLKHMSGLPEESRAVKDQATIAAVMGISGRMVRRHLRRAEALLASWRNTGAVEEDHHHG
jgi:RNA polymerase sigma factor (sigma-70 family)